MDNRINEIRSQMNLLRTEMVCVEDAMREQIKHDLDCTESALRLMAMRKDLAALVADWKGAGGSEPLPTMQERLKTNNRTVRNPKASISS